MQEKTKNSYQNLCMSKKICIFAENLIIMKTHLSLFILCNVLFCCGFVQAEESSFYDLPKGAFAAGMTENGDTAVGAIYLPHIYKGTHKFSSTTGKGDWYSKSKLQKENQETYSYSNAPMNKSYSMPQLVQEGKRKYQYGARSEVFDSYLFFYVGDSAMHYLTPAKLWTDLVTAPEKGYLEGLDAHYNTDSSDVMGVYFNNITVLYIDGISIPISVGGTEEAKTKTEANLFSEGARVVVNIYKATAIGGGTKNKADKSNVIWSDTLTADNFTPFKDNARYRGALNVTFAEPISIDGAFVVELSGMKTSGCHFYVFCDQSNARNQWGYYIEDGVETYPDSHCLAVSVHAMFPALCQDENESLDIEMPAIGADWELDNRPERTIYANLPYSLEGNDWSTEKSEGLDIEISIYASWEDYTKWFFSMPANTTDSTITGKFHFIFRGKTLTYNITQPPIIEDALMSVNETQGARAQKRIVDGQLVILCNGKRYNILGIKE